MKAKSTELSKAAVIFGYRFLLGRQPESESVIQYHLDTHPDFESFRAAMVGCSEFRAAFPPSFVDTIETGYWTPPTKIDYEVSAATEARLIERTRNQWTKLGEEEPYWSVLTGAEFRSDRINDETLANFKETGRKSADLIDLTLERVGTLKVGGVCVELGCGVGRITRYLAERFDKVIAIDISPGNLALCEKYLDDENISNVETMLIKEASDLANLANYDFFYSLIVLQHNTPPVQFRMLDLLLGRIAQGGNCLFQAVVDMPGYAFDAEAYLATEESVMEMHSLPMLGVLKLMQKHGIVAQSVRMDPWVGFYGSYTFLGHKSAVV